MHIKILFYLAIYSFLGWCLESVYKTILEKKPVNSGFLYGPLCPIYGFGAVIMILLLSKLKDNILLLFIVATLILTLWEYIVGLILEKVFKTKYWDYSHLKFNFQGRICLKNSIYWGILGILFTLLIHPEIEKLVLAIPSKTLLILDIIIYIIMITDLIISINKILFIDKKIKQVNEIGNQIKEKLSEIAQYDIKGKAHIENMKIINDLKEQQAILKFKLYKRIVRLKKAFPTMQSEVISTFVGQKLDTKILKEKLEKYKAKIKQKSYKNKM